MQFISRLFTKYSFTKYCDTWSSTSFTFNFTSTPFFYTSSWWSEWWFKPQWSQRNLPLRSALMFGLYCSRSMFSNRPCKGWPPFIAQGQIDTCSLSAIHCEVQEGALHFPTCEDLWIMLNHALNKLCQLGREPHVGNTQNT